MLNRYTTGPCAAGLSLATFPVYAPRISLSSVARQIRRIHRDSRGGAGMTGGRRSGVAARRGTCRGVFGFDKVRYCAYTPQLIA